MVPLHQSAASIMAPAATILHARTLTSVSSAMATINARSALLAVINSTSSPTEPPRIPYHRDTCHPHSLTIPISPSSTPLPTHFELSLFTAPTGPCKSSAGLDLSSSTCSGRSGRVPSVHLYLPYGPFRLGLHHLLQPPEFGSFVTTSSTFAFSDDAYALYERFRITAASFGIPFNLPISHLLLRISIHRFPSRWALNDN